MESKTTSYGGGAGGKLRKPPPRKPPSKPYDRPPPPKSQWWLSKLVGGATRILPSFFSNATDLYPDAEVDNNGNSDHDVEVAPPKMDDLRCDSSQAVITPSKEAHPDEVPESSKRFSDPVFLGKGKQICSSDQSEISRIEQLIEGKTFSRDEIDHLIEILNSKTLDAHEAARGTRETVTAAAVESERTLLTRQGRQEDYNRAIPGTPLPQLKVGDKIGASPIDIAKSFMGSRKLEPCATPSSVSAKAEETLQLIESVSKPLILSPSPMSSPHWPGTMVADQRRYVSPLSHEGRYGIHDFPRTPYSRTIYSKSRAKPPADSRYPSSSSNFFQKSRIPIYEQIKTRDDTLQDHHGSVGPIRRMRSKFSSESRSRGSIFSKPLVEVSNGSKVLPAEKNLEPNDTRNNSKALPVGIGPSGSEDSNSFLTPSTSQAVRRILEHLDRTKPTPKQKAAEVERATAWRKPAASRFDDMGKATASLSHDSKVDLVSKGNYGNTTSDVQIKSPKVAIKETEIAAQGCASTSNLDGVSGMINPGGKEFCSRFDSIAGSASWNSPEQANNGMSSRLQKESSKPQIDNGIYATNYSFELPKRPVAEVTSSKPILSSISISKPDPRRMVSSGNGIGFTFPVSASFGVMSEPPTPSIMPSSSATVVSSPQTPVSTVPSYSFGSKRTSPPLVFSFPGVTIPSSNDASDLKFNFGSDKSSRLSFKSVGKGPI
ncbi:hypothetical protein LIER_03842 [Lithospermum erythrorhizon]|uniref:Nuclear pore complex protein NUP1-like n=1 Tax=Lithospermum erythrorhizon TaxID=34254 RepID=A0AAV3NUM0_LITER